MKTLLIDLWGTLLRNPELHPITQIVRELQIGVRDSDFLKICEKNGLFTQTVDSLTVWKSILQELGHDVFEAERANNIWLTSSREAHLFPGTREFLKTLKERGYRIVLASAIDKDSFEILDEIYKLQTLFDEVKLTFEVGYNKTPEYYRKICKDLDLAPEDTTMIGDNIHYDIIPADEVGLQTIFLTRFLLSTQQQMELPKETVVCDSYEQVLDQL